ncbi:MAG: helix-turn-helix transcriptional regulator [Moritella sp.]|uniref:helix-turn-helix domain-containing protein n=1 Tax=Moritella sp. TaxID=78556 RepID=UPI0029B8BB73|nr:helix-turn-helix transcriptional regulator [Moritella sp.]MDX2321902.1 helix-turn-helix transcriptional regulator [Moritella sp.]
MDKILTNSIQQYAIHKGWLQLLIQAAQEYGLDTDHYFPESNFGIQPLRSYDVRQMRAIHLQMLNDSKDTLFSVKAAKNINPLTFSHCSLLFWTAPNLLTLLKDISEYSIILGSPFRIRFNEMSNGDVELWFFNNEPLNKESHVTYLGVTLYIATIIEIINQTTGNKLPPIDIFLMHWPYIDCSIDKFEAGQECHIHLGSPVRKLLIKQQHLSLPLISNDSAIYPQMLTQLRKQKATLESKDIILQIYKTLDEFPHLADISAPKISALILMSSRTMHRRLEEVGSSYRDVIEKYKLEKALQLLNQPNIMMTEIAFQLGFADLSSFSRAFRRWSGISPSQLHKNNTVI